MKQCRFNKHSDELTERQTACSMKKINLVLRISKVKYASGNRGFVIHNATDPSSLPHAISLPPGIFPETGSENLERLRRQTIQTFEEIFSLANRRSADTSSVEYKCIFSDKFVATGSSVSSAHSRVEIIKELTVPMSDTECCFIFDCIPTHY